MAERIVLSALRNQFLNTSPQARVILAVSGGVDSIALLEGAVRAAPHLERLIVAHVNHNLRGDESRGDAALVRDRAQALGLDYRETCLIWGDEVSSQALCRKRRDVFFRSLLSGPADRVWLAHHLNDQAETVFFRLLRGTGARGLRGMLPENGFKVRPFLGIEKATLVAAARAFGSPWREDSSNADMDAYERNWLRGFFPQLEERRPGFQKKLAALAEEAQGWAFPPVEFDSFAVAPGVSLYRPPKGVLPTRVLAETFALSRLHAVRLGELLCKPSGEWHAERARFTWSGGMLLRESGAVFSLGFRGRGSSLSGTLGEWTLPRGSRVIKGDVRGESRKKEFQALRVPRFLRPGVPLVSYAGRTRAALPGRVPGLVFAPSLLAEWWLNSSVKN